MHEPLKRKINQLRINLSRPVFKLMDLHNFLTHILMSLYGINVIFEQCMYERKMRLKKEMDHVAMDSLGQGGGSRK